MSPSMTMLALIPWFELPNLSLGPFTIQSFGVLSALGILAAVKLAERGARETGRNPQVILDFAVVGVLTGILVGHAVHLLAYHPEELQDWRRVLKFWEGLSSMGGLAGGVIAAFAFFRVRRIRFHDYADAFALGVAPGWGIARIGCFTVHDHPGVHTTFPLAVAFPDGPRHDLGLYEAIVLLGIAALLWTLHRRGMLRERLLPLLAVLYGIARFLLDFLRATDVPYADARYLGLTPAQYACFALWAYAAWRFLTPVPQPVAKPRARPASRAAGAGPGGR